MGRLYGSRSYQVGAMDRVPDGGVAWRDNLKPFLNSLGIWVFNPCDKPLRDIDADVLAYETPEARASRAAAKQGGDLRRVAREMKLVRATDLRMVDITDFIVVNIDINVHATGTYEEITTANRQRKPILVHVEGGVQNTPDWLIAMLGEKAVDDFTFNSWEELKTYLVTIDKVDPQGMSRLNLHHRWVFFDLERLEKEAEEGYRAANHVTS